MRADKVTPARNAGKLGWAIIAVLLILGVVGKVRGCNSPYGKARRLVNSDPCAAAALFVEDVRRDWKGSTRSLIELQEIDQPCVLRHLIDLMDVPEGQWIDKNTLQFLEDSVQGRTSDSKRVRPAFTPTAPLHKRMRQKAEWMAWLEAVSQGDDGPATRTATTTKAH